jgi:hypothetical protein
VRAQTTSANAHRHAEEFATNSMLRSSDVKVMSEKGSVTAVYCEPVAESSARAILA